MKKILILISIIALPVISVFGQNKINHYEYWFDANYAAKTDVSISPVATLNLNASIATTNISNGLHTFHIRFCDDSSHFSAPISQFFQKLPSSTSSSKQIVAFEYWFDTNYAAKVNQAVTPQSALALTSALSATTLLPGLHIIHIRFKDDGGGWSSVTSQFFQKVSASTSASKQVVAYEYWYDNNYAAKVYQSVTPLSTVQLMNALDASALVTGLHIIHIRFKDDGGAWSSVLSQFFQKVSSSTASSKQVVAYEYWYDNNYAGKVYQSVTPLSTVQLMNNLDASALAAGLHVIHIRFKDDGGAWSSVLSQFFQKVSGGTGLTNEITAYEYWFDNNYAGKIYQTVAAQNQIQLLASIDAMPLSNGLHIFHVRFKDAENSWSSTISNFFQKTGQNSAIANYITKYRYWFDSADSVMFETQLSTPQNLYTLNTPLALSVIHKGNHLIHFQFADSLKNWSCVTSDSVYKYPVVVADFTPNNWIVCDSGNVNFTNISFDADTFKWVFDDATTSNLQNPSHFYNALGTHPVILIAYDTLEGVTDTLVLDISVVHSPTFYLGNDTSACAPGIILNAWIPDCSYLWSNLSSDSLIHATNSGTYSVIVTNQWGCSSRDTINLIINSLPVINLGNDTTICVGNTILLDPGSGYTYYNWSTGDVTQSVTVSAANTYSVEVTNTNGCHATDSIHIFTDPCTGIEDMSGQDFVSIYPNPNNGQYFIKSLSDLSEPVDIRITDLTGRILLEYNHLILSKDQVLQVNNENFSNGVYMIFLNSKSANITKRIVITH
jgi:hypothetical protein